MHAILRFARPRTALGAAALLTRLLVPGAAMADDAPSAWTDASGFSNRRIAVNGTWLHVVDYGGEGPALVFLAGLGNSAHVFDGFAPRFADRAHVLAFTRRGYGESDRPRSGFDTATLAVDVLALCDSLALGPVVLVGHSVAGDELTECAARHPDRIAGLVYLDAAYDRSHTTARLLSMAVLGQIPPAPPGPSGRDRASPVAAADYLERLYGVRWPAGEVAATRKFDVRGRWAGEATPASTNGKVVAGESAPRWQELRAPVLAIYAVDRPESRDFPWIRRMVVGRGAAQLRAARYRAAQGRWEAAQRRRLSELLPSARIVELAGASHYVFLSDSDRVEREMREFFLTLR